MYIYVGGQRSYSTSSGSFTSGGFNGGGAAGYRYGGSGGGASDIRLGQDSLYARVIVAGAGGGGWGYRDYDGGYGGGESGGTGSGYSSSYYGKPGTQTSGGASVSYSATSSAGAFGVGGNAASSSSSYNRSSGGGGGWYGGGGTTYYSSSRSYYRGGAGAGGGSGYVYTSTTYSNYPSGCLLTDEYYLTNAQTIAGNSSIPSTSGSTETGHSGNGYVRITVIEIEPTKSINMPVNIGGTWKDGSEIYVNIGGTWKTAESVYVNIGGTWK